jgi:hypothetical protein
MKKILILIASLILSACAQYLLATNFDKLHKGMTKQEFIDTWQNKNKKIIGGGTPTSSSKYTKGKDGWEILIYSVYKRASAEYGLAVVDHKEYVAFKNGLLEEWGVGTIPHSLKDDSSEIHFKPGY